MEGLTGKYCFQNIENSENVENLFEHGWHRLHGYEERKLFANSDIWQGSTKSVRWCATTTKGADSHEQASFSTQIKYTK